MAKRLYDMEIEEGSFVDAGSNQLAKIVFFKRDGAEQCGSCGVGRIGANGACDFCWNKQVQKIEKTTFFKQETEDKTMKVLPGKSEKDAVWTQMEEAFDKYQKGVLDVGYRAQGNAFTPLSRDKLFAKWLTSEEGAALYEEYQNASDVVAPINKSEGPTNLKEFGWLELEKIAKRHQESAGGTIEAAHAACARDNAQYSAIYTLVHDAYPLDETGFSERISKSKSDAIGLVKAKILVEASKAGV